MAEFHRAKIEDKPWVEEILSRDSCESLENNFTTLFIWQDMYNIKISKLCGGDFYTTMTDTKEPAFMFPCGSGDIKAALEEIFDYCKTPDFYSVTENERQVMEELYPGVFEFTENRDAEDYVYETEKLCTLSGRKLSSKRNHINRFVQNNPDWSYEEITKANIDEAYEMNEKWCAQMVCEENEGLRNESCAVRTAFRNYFDLKLSGGLIRAGGRVVAYSMGDRLSRDTFLVHIEKAFADIQGAYTIMNREFVLHNCEGYRYVNREDDAGDEGLRKAKLSYKPYKLVTKYTAKYKG